MESNEKVTLEQIDGQAQELAEQQNTTPVKKKTSNAFSADW